MIYQLARTDKENAQAAVSRLLSAFCNEHGIPSRSIDELLLEYPQYESFLQPLAELWAHADTPETAPETAPPALSTAEVLQESLAMRSAANALCASERDIVAALSNADHCITSDHDNFSHILQLALIGFAQVNAGK